MHTLERLCGARRSLGDAFIEFIRAAKEGLAGSRTVPAQSGIVYVFVACPRSTGGSIRTSVLQGYCAILREDYPEARAIVSIITEIPDGDWRHSFGLMVIDEPLDEQTREIAAKAREHGILRKQTVHHAHYREYPDDALK